MLLVLAVERSPKGIGLRCVEQLAILHYVAAVFSRFADNFRAGKNHLQRVELGTRLDILPKRIAGRIGGGHDIEMVVRARREAQKHHCAEASAFYRGFI